MPGRRASGERGLRLVRLELLGLGTLCYALATVAELFVSGQLSGLLDERRTETMIDSLDCDDRKFQPPRRFSPIRGAIQGL